MFLAKNRGLGQYSLWAEKIVMKVVIDEVETPNNELDYLINKTKNNAPCRFFVRTVVRTKYILKFLDL